MGNFLGGERGLELGWVLEKMAALGVRGGKRGSNTDWTT